MNILRPNVKSVRTRLTPIVLISLTPEVLSHFPGVFCVFFSINPIFHYFVSQFVPHDFISLFFFFGYIFNLLFLKIPINWGPGGAHFNRQNNLFSLCLPWVLI